MTRQCERRITFSTVSEKTCARPAASHGSRHGADQDQAGVGLARLVRDGARDRPRAQHAALDLDAVVGSERLAEREQLARRPSSSGIEQSSDSSSGTSITFSAITLPPSGWASFDAVASISSSIGPACLHGHDDRAVRHLGERAAGRARRRRHARAAASRRAGARSRRRSRRRAARAAARPGPRGGCRARAARRATRAGSPPTAGSGISERPKRTFPRIITGRGRDGSTTRSLITARNTAMNASMRPNE